MNQEIDRREMLTGGLSAFIAAVLLVALGTHAAAAEEPARPWRDDLRSVGADFENPNCGFLNMANSNEVMMHVATARSGGISIVAAARLLTEDEADRIVGHMLRVTGALPSSEAA
jgi:hypothetical protein